MLRFAVMASTVAVVMIASALIHARTISRANLRSENEMLTAGMNIAPFYIFPAANVPGPGGRPNVEFKLGVPNMPDATTGRWTVLKNPQTAWHVYGPGIKQHHRCEGGKRAVVSEQAQENQCQFATNASPFSYASNALCEGPIVSDGHVITEGVARPTGATCIGIFKPSSHDGSFIMGDATAIHHSGHMDSLQQLICGFDWLVVNGSKISSGSKLIAPRTALGVDYDGNLVTIVAEGSEVAKTGLTLNQTASWLAGHHPTSSDASLKLRFAVNFDGGGSSTVYNSQNGGVQGCPTGVDTPTCVERDVATITCIG